MYRLEDLEELLKLPNNVENCIVDYQKVLEYIYRNKKEQKLLIDIDLLHEILVKNIKDGYERKIMVKDIVLTSKDLDKLCVVQKHKEGLH